MKHSIGTSLRAIMLVMAIAAGLGSALAADPITVYAH